jgi:outer membrane protein TolC
MDERMRTGKPGNLSRSKWPMLAVVMVLGWAALVGGCTRAFYRRSADREVNDVLAEKDRSPEWKIEQFHVYPDPRARFADPTNPDRPPMPPDDQAAYSLSPHSQVPGHAGVGAVEGTGYLEMIKAWDEENRAKRTAAKEGDKTAASQEDQAGAAGRTGAIQTYFDEPLSAERRGFLITLDQAVELGLVNSRTYQQFREDLYLAALPVTLERFSFAYQFAVVENAVRAWAGPQSLEGHQNNWSLATTGGFTKLFSTGALLTFQFANDTVFNFLAGVKGFTSVSNINLNLVQPLLRGGGKAVTLEPLTQSERTLLYSVRAYARFREQFFVGVAIGSSVPASLAAATGTGVGSSPISVLASLGIASTDVAGGFVGYLSTLFRELDTAADRKYVSELEKALKIYEGYQEGGLFSPLQVDQVRSTLLNARNTVLTDQQFVANALDQFKLLLGLPANLPLILDDTPARPITRQFDRYYQVLAESDAAYKLVEAQDTLDPGKLRAFLLELYTTNPLVRGTEFQKKLPPAWSALAKLSDQDLQKRLQQLGEQRRLLLDTKADLELKGQALSAAQEKDLRDADFENDLGGLEQVLRRYEARPWEKAPGEAQRRLERGKLFRIVAYGAELLLVWARNERFTHVGTLWPTPPSAPLGEVDLLTADVEEAQETAVKAALQNRWDLMNARAQVVDAWRQLAVTANALLGVLNVTYHLDSTTPPGGTNPLAFATSRTGQQLILNGSLPLVRVAERNAYRTALINYQRARRALMSLEDNIAAQVRFDVRQLHLFGENYKIQQKVIQSLYSQVENALELIVAPVDPESLKSTGTAAQANAAALTNQYLSALGSLNNSQTKMYDIWLSFLATRMQLYLDLERLPLDLRGVWTDEFGKSADSLGTAGGSACFSEPGGGDAGGASPDGHPAGGASFGEPVPGDEWGTGAAEPLWRPRSLVPPAAAPPMD